MSGTSLDGVDCALCEAGPAGLRLVAWWRKAFPRSMRQRLHEAARGGLNAHALAQLHHDLGRFYARCASAQPAGPRPQLAGLHGQTVFHQPDGPAAATLQLGEPAYLAEALRVPVVANFRVADLAAGGQGAPLATAFHVRMFARRGQHVCVNNLGGISNVTSIDWQAGGRNPHVWAFDTGPANVLLDLAARRFSQGRLDLDRGGRWAARGRVCEPLLQRWLEHPFFTKPPPKSTGRELFGEPFLAAVLKEARPRRLSRFDVLATLTELTARSIALNYRLHLGSPPDRVILAGGGAANPMLVERIRAALRNEGPGVTVRTSAELGWPLQSVEPAAFAWLAWLRVHGLPGNLPETTGACRPVLLGQIAEP